MGFPFRYPLHPPIISSRFFLPQILPDGKALLFTVVEEGRLQVAVQSLESGERNYLFPGHSARYLPTGHILYALENDLFAVPFDTNSLEVSGGGIPVTEEVFRATSLFPAHFAVSDAGTLVYLPGSLSMARSRNQPPQTKSTSS